MTTAVRPMTNDKFATCRGVIAWTPRACPRTVHVTPCFMTGASDGNVHPSPGFSHSASTRPVTDQLPVGWCHRILQALPEGVWVVEADGTTVAANAAMGAMLGWDPQRLVRRPLLEFVAEAGREVMRAQLERSVRGAVEQHDFELIRADGLICHTVVKTSPLGDVGAATAVVLAVQDATEKIKIERKLLDAQKLESLGVLAGGIAHDFNNILAGVLGNANLARLELPAAAVAHPYLEQIERAAVRAADLCKQLLAYSGRGRFIVERLDVNAVIDDTLQLLQLSIGKGAVLKLHLHRPMPAISGDATQIQQLVMNLVLNASEAIGSRSGVISVTTGVVRADRDYLSRTHFSPDLPEGDYVYLEVSDNGCGMTRETVARIFDPFFTTKFSGRGLGLSAVLGIVRGHNGGIKVYSEPGRGSTFKALFPVVDGLPEPAPQAPGQIHAWRGQGHVLVIDDEESVRAMLARALRLFGFTSEQADGGPTALERVRAAPGQFSCVLLDLTMPHMDGEETYRALRQLRPDLPVLLMSGFNEKDAVSRFAGKGLAGFLQKPFEIENLRRKLSEVFGGA